MSATRTILRCGVCTRGLPAATYNQGALACPWCGTGAEILVLPSYYREPPAPAEAPDAVSGEAECYACPGRAAEVACDHCGLLMCSRCDVPFQGGHYCLTCLANARKEKGPSDVSDRYLRMDHIAFTLAFAPLLIIFYGWLVTFITAPAALYLALRHFKRPVSAAPRNPGWYLAAIFLSAIQTGLWVVLFFWGVVQLVQGTGLL